MCEAFNLIVIDLARFGIEPVLHGIVDTPGEAHACTVGKVTTVGEAHAQHSIARLHQRHVNSCVCLRTGVRLHVCIVGVVELFSAIDRELLNHVNVFAATVVTLTGVAFGVFIRQDRALSFHDKGARMIL